MIQINPLLLMKTSFRILSFSLIAFAYTPMLVAQDILWEKSFGGIHTDYLMDALPTPDFGFILAGSSLSAKTGNKTQDNNGDLDYWVWKMKENGDLDWQKSFGGSGNDFLHSIKLTNDGGFVLAGTSASTLPELGDSSQARSDKKEACRGGDDIWVIKLDASGTQEWQKTIGGMAQEKLKAICPTKDGGYILGGSSASPAPSTALGMTDPEELKLYGEKKSEAFGNMDYWLVKLDRKGKIEWQKSFGGIYEEELRSIDATNDGGYIVGGYSNSPVSGNKTEDNKGVGDFWVLKLDSKGDITWQKTIGGNQDDQLYVVHQTYDGNYVVGGNSNSDTSNEKSKSNASGTDIWILKLGQEGEILWQETYNIGEVDVLSSVVENKDHTLLLGGFCQAEGRFVKAERRTQKQDKGIGDYVAIKITETGQELWRQSVGTDGDDLLKKVVETRDGGYLLAGISLPPIPSEGGGAAARSSNALAGIQQTENKQLQNATNEVKQAITDVQNDINKGINDKMTSTTNAINDAVGSDKESSLKYGLNTPTGGVTLPYLSSPDPSKGGENGAGALEGLANAMSSKQGKPSTGDQKKAFGSSDFWVVKLRDKDKKVVARTSVEAMPNPATTFTNVIVGYEYQTGTATVADIAGHVLQQFEIKNQTIPIDLSAYPEGIYIVNIKTNKGNDGVKVIKRLNRN
jgi:Secretion system C-terminal sorting domain